MICTKGCPIGSHINIKWPRNKWYSGVVTEYSILDDEHFVVYDDGKDEQWEDLKEIRWKFLEVDNHGPPTTKEDEPVAAANVPSTSGANQAASSLWRTAEESCFIDLRGKRKISMQQDADAALSRATNGLVEQLPRSVKEAAKVIETLCSQSRDGKMSALGRRLIGRDTAPPTTAAVHLMCEHMSEQVLSEDGHNAQCAVLQGLHGLCSAQAAHGAELDVVKAQAQLSAAEDALDSMSRNDPALHETEQAVATCRAKLQGVVCIQTDSGGECSYAGTVPPLRPTAARGSGKGAHVELTGMIKVHNQQLKEQGGKWAVMRHSSVECPATSMGSLTKQINKEKARVEATHAALDSGDATLAAAYQSAEEVADH